MVQREKKAMNPIARGTVASPRRSPADRMPTRSGRVIMPPISEQDKVFQKLLGLRAGRTVPSRKGER